MANVDVSVLESDGVTTKTVRTLDFGRQAAAASKSLALSTEDKAVLDSLATKLDTAITALQIIDNMVLAAGTARIGTVGLHDGTNALSFTDAAVSASAFALPVIQHPDGQNANGRASAANSTPTVASTEDKAVLDAIETATEYLAGGLEAPFLSLDLDESEELIKTGAGRLFKLRLTNRTTSARYVKLYDGVLAGVTVGTTTPIDTIVVPGGASADLCTVLTENFGGLGLPFTTGLCIAATTGLAHTDTGAPGANDVVASAYYK